MSLISSTRKKGRGPKLTCFTYTPPAMAANEAAEMMVRIRFMFGCTDSSYATDTECYGGEICEWTKLDPFS
jgi:hypothetical protein